MKVCHFIVVYLVDSRMMQDDDDVRDDEMMICLRSFESELRVLEDLPNVRCGYSEVRLC
jgi:hypothetical protein